MNDTNRHVHPQPRLDRTQRPLLRAHKRAFLLLFFYIPLVLIPWVVTMVLVYRPLTRQSWTYAPGFSNKDYKVMRAWATAIPIMNAFAAILAITVTSAIIAQAAVIFAERRHPGQQLSVKHLFSLADRVWCDWGALPRAVVHGKAPVNCFLLGAAALVILGAIQYPLFQILAPWKEISVPNCRSTQYITARGYGMRRCDAEYKSHGSYTQIGKDLEPAQLAVVPAPYITPRIKNDLAKYTPQTKSPHLWQDIDESGYHAPGNMDNTEKPGFVAALPAGSTTGVLREHIMRMNSTISCTNVTTSGFPSTCSGTNPFQASFVFENRRRSWNGTLDICAPGDQAKHPWTLSRNRQEVTEELFFKYKEMYYSETGDDDSAVEVLHCTAQTTRGYFELGNAYNGGEFGPLLDKWPSTGPPSQEYQFNDWFESEWGSGQGTTTAYFPSEEDQGRGAAIPIPDPSSDYYTPDTYTNVTGPLMTSVLAIFGPDSWTHDVLNLTNGKTRDELEASHTGQAALLQLLCDQTPYARSRTSVYVSYSRFSCADSLYGLRTTLEDALTEWTIDTYTEEKLRAAMFFSNQALLTSHTEGFLPWEPWTGREIYTAEGWTVWKPDISLPAQIVLSITVGLHVLGLLTLGWFIQKWPAWTRTLDAMAIARIAASLDPSLLSPIRKIKPDECEPLADVDGLVGVQENETRAERRRSAEGGIFEHSTDQEIEMEALSIASTAGKQPTSSAAPAYDSIISLGLGAPGLIAQRGRQLAAPSTERTADV